MIIHIYIYILLYTHCIQTCIHQPEKFRHQSSGPPARAPSPAVRWVDFMLTNNNDTHSSKRNFKQLIIDMRDYLIGKWLSPHEL